MIIVNQDGKLVNFDNVETLWPANEQDGVEIIANTVRNDQVIIGKTKTMEEADKILKYIALKIAAGSRMFSWTEVPEIDSLVKKYL